MNAIIRNAIGAALLVACAEAHAGLFSGRLGDLKDLVAANKIEAATQLMIREQAYFAKLTGADAAWVDAFRKRLVVDDLQSKVASGNDLQALELLKISAADFASLPEAQQPRYRSTLAVLDARGETLAIECIGRLVAANSRDGMMPRWKELSAALVEARARSTAIQASATQLPRSALAAVKLAKAIAQVEAELSAEARTAFADYGYFTEPAFNRVYPLSQKMAGLMDQDVEALNQALQNANSEQLNRFRTLYVTDLSDAWKSRLSQHYFKALLAERKPQSYFAKQTLRREARASGYVLPENGNVLLLIGPDLTANKGRLILRPPSKTPYRSLRDSDKPSTIVSSAEASQQDLLVFLRVTPVRSQRIVAPQKSIKAEYQSGIRQVSNPEWAEARDAVSRAERSLAEAKASAAKSDSNGGSAFGVALTVLSAMSEASAESTLESAKRRLAQTPQLLEEPVMLAYSYTRTDIEVTDQWQLAAAIYDSASRKTWTYGTSQSTRSNFSVFAGLNAADPSAAAVSAKGVTLAAVDEYQKKPSQADYEKMWNDVLLAYRKAMTGA